MSEDDPYAILGVARTATQDEIKHAYRKLARTLHPDLNPGDKQAEEKFKKLGAAHDLLSDPAKRARFDAGEIDSSGAERQRRGYRTYAGAGRRGGAGGDESSFRFGDNADDIFAELLRRRNRGRQGWDFFSEEEGGDRPSRGAGARYSLSVAFQEAVMGATRRITLPTGKSLDVKVPPGTKDGSVLRLKGQGGPGLNGGPAGDAQIEIKVEPHPFFVRDGDDILITLPITLAEAIGGGKITVPTIDGKVALKVPAWSSSGTVLRLKGKGVPTGKKRGDQLVTLKLVLPEKPDPELETFIAQWAAKNPQDVRTKAGMA